VTVTLKVTPARESRGTRAGLPFLPTEEEEEEVGKGRRNARWERFPPPA